MMSFQRSGVLTDDELSWAISRQCSDAKLRAEQPLTHRIVLALVVGV